MSDRCLGRFVRDDGREKGTHQIPFDQGECFHIPYRCREDAVEGGDLCERCLRRAETTAEKVAKITGISLQGNHPSYFHGRVTEPIPFWSHVFGGAWYRLKIASGYTVSEEGMARAKKAEAKAQEGVGAAPEPAPLATVKKGRPAAGVKKAAASAAPVASPREQTKLDLSPRPTETVEAPPPVVTAPPKLAPKKKKKAVAAVADQPPVPQYYVPQDVPIMEVEEVVRIPVRKVTVGERSLYLDASKDKLYDMKLKYVGRWDRREDTVVDFPDSDAEA